MMWPVGDFYDEKNDISQDELAFAQIFRQHGREDTADIILGGRPWQRTFFFLGGLPKERGRVRWIVSRSESVFLPFK